MCENTCFRSQCRVDHLTGQSVPEDEPQKTRHWHLWPYFSERIWHSSPAGGDLSVLKIANSAEISIGGFRFEKFCLFIGFRDFFAFSVKRKLLFHKSPVPLLATERLIVVIVFVKALPHRDRTSTNECRDGVFQIVAFLVSNEGWSSWSSCRTSLSFSLSFV